MVIMMINLDDYFLLIVINYDDPHGSDAGFELGADHDDQS